MELHVDVANLKLVPHVDLHLELADPQTRCKLTRFLQPLAEIGEAEVCERLTMLNGDDQKLARCPRHGRKDAEPVGAVQHLFRLLSLDDLAKRAMHE